MIYAMAKSVNGKTAIGVFTTIMLLGVSAAIWEVRANNGHHLTMSKDLASAKEQCMKSRTADLQRVAHLEEAIYRIDENMREIRKVIERIDR